MLDSLLTLRKGAAAWMAGFLLACVAADRVVSALTGTVVSIFLVLALGILCAFVVMSIYTLGKMALGALRRDGSDEGSAD
jgi:hypothetical protein